MDKDPNTNKKTKNFNKNKNFQNEADNYDDEIDDAEYFKQEVGQEPESG